MQYGDTDALANIMNDGSLEDTTSYMTKFEERLGYVDPYAGDATITDGSGVAAGTGDEASSGTGEEAT
jgi:hypothetical protein